MSKEIFEMLESTWEVVPNPLLKTELMIVQQSTQNIIARINLADFEEDEIGYAYAELIAAAPLLRNKVLRLEINR